MAGDKVEWQGPNCLDCEPTKRNLDFILNAMVSHWRVLSKGVTGFAICLVDGEQAIAG